MAIRLYCLVEFRTKISVYTTFEILMSRCFTTARPIAFNIYVVAGWTLQCFYSRNRKDGQCAGQQLGTSYPGEKRQGNLTLK